MLTRTNLETIACPDGFSSYTIAGYEKCLKMIYEGPLQDIHLNQTHLYCDPSTTKLPLPRSEQENDDYHAAFWNMFLATNVESHVLMTVALDLNDADKDGVWLDSNGEAPVWDNWGASYPEYGFSRGYHYAFTFVNFPQGPNGSQLMQKQWVTSPVTTSVVCEYNPCFNPHNCVMDQNLCKGPLSSVFTNDELMPCLDDATSDIEVDSLVYTRKTITGIRSGQRSILDNSEQVNICQIDPF